MVSKEKENNCQRTFEKNKKKWGGNQERSFREKSKIIPLITVNHILLNIFC